MHQDETWYGGSLSPGYLVLVGDPAHGLGLQLKQGSLVLSDCLSVCIFMRPRRTVTPPKVKRYGLILEHSDSEYIVWNWPWHILGAIR